MSEENIEIVRRIIEAANQGDAATVLKLYDPEITLDTSRLTGLLGGGGVYHGHDGLRKWFREWTEPWSELHYDYDELIDAGDHYVVGTGSMRGRGAASGADVDWTAYAVWTVRGGKVVRLVWFPTRSEALDAVVKE